MSEDYFKIHRSKKSMKQKLTDKSIRYIIRELKKGKSTKILLEEINVTQRHVQRLQVEYLKTKTVHIQRPAGRPKSHGPSDEEIKTVLDAQPPKTRWSGTNSKPAQERGTQYKLLSCIQRNEI